MAYKGSGGITSYIMDFGNRRKPCYDEEKPSAAIEEEARVS
jgi:hypothetical protein